VAIGECGLDYYYNHSPRDLQLTAFRAQIELAQDLKRPLIFHIREAFDDFFAVVAEYKNLRGVVHSFTADEATLNKVLDQGFYVAFNGIITFTKDQAQLAAAKACPLDKMMLETDCPFLTPVPHRGQRNEPAHVKLVAEFLAQLRSESFAQIAAQTTKNAESLFGI
jgi:TatD DNase family protein